MIRKSGYILFIEGTRDSTNGNLHVGFSNLFKQKLEGKMPHIVMGDGYAETLRKYKTFTKQRIAHSLIDLDGKGANATQGNYAILKDNRRKLLDLAEDDLVFFIVQKMEAWFLSQPNVLEEHFKINLSGKIPFDHPSKVEEPDKILKENTKHSKRGSYHKVRDGSRLLEKLDLFQLEKDFEDVKALLKQLSNG